MGYKNPCRRNIRKIFDVSASESLILEIHLEAADFVGKSAKKAGSKQEIWIENRDRKGFVHVGAGSFLLLWKCPAQSALKKWHAFCFI